MDRFLSPSPPQKANIFNRRPIMSVRSTKASSRISNKFRTSSGRQEEFPILKRRNIQPELAAQVVRRYVLPLFNSETNELQTGRSGIFKEMLGLNGKRPLEVIQGTVYGELVLSDHVMSELEAINAQIAEMQQKVMDAEQGRESVNTELEVVKKRQIEVQAELDAYKERTREAKGAARGGLEMVKMEQHASIYKKLITESDQKIKNATAKLHEEKALNDKRRNIEAELGHGNELLGMENSIMDEKISGMAENLANLPKEFLMDYQALGETEMYSRAIANIAGMTLWANSELKRIESDFDELSKDHSEIKHLLDEVSSIRDKVNIALKDTFNQLNRDLNLATELRDDLREKLSSLEKSYKETSEELNKMRKKLRSFRQSNRETEEKICKLCNRIYFENENFNWSCKTHLGKYSGEMYWCCLKAGKDAAGCYVSKHEPKNEEEDELKQMEDAKLYQYNARCSSCKQIGHKAHECPKDPNVRTVGDPVDEDSRIDQIKEQKRGNQENWDVSQKMMDVLNQRFGNFSFGQVESSEDTYTVEQEEEEESSFDKKQKPFRDLQGVKYELSFDHDTNYIKLNDVQTEEERIEAAAKLKGGRRSSAVI